MLTEPYQVTTYVNRPKDPRLNKYVIAKKPPLLLLRRDSKPGRAFMHVESNHLIDFKSDMTSFTTKTPPRSINGHSDIF